MQNNRRVAIFVFYDQEGIVDRYVEHLLADLVRNLERLVIVCNGTLQSQGHNRLSVYSDCIIQRKNEGYDIWGYKAGIDALGWEEISRYDELVLCNDSVMGPIYPFREMFDEMDSREVDFWGITKHYEASKNPFADHSNIALLEHIQSYFMVFRHNILSDGRFRRYWAQLPMPHSYEEAVNGHEITFTAKLAEMGYIYDVYANMDDYREYTPDPIMMSPDILVRAKRCPVVKKRIFIRDYGVSLYETAGGAPARLMEYLEQHTDFDVDMIWDNILRTGRLDRITYNLQLHYILGGSGGRTEKSFNTAIVFLDSKAEDFLMPLPQGAMVHELSTEQLMSKEGEGIISQYDLICLLPEIAMYDGAQGSSTVDLKHHIFYNLISDVVYLHQVEECFRMHPRLGILYPPLACHGSYAENMTTWMGGWYRREALEEMRRTDIKDRSGCGHRYYAAVAYNQTQLPQLLNNQSYYMEAHRQLINEHGVVVQEWTQCKEAHDRVVTEWQKTAEQLKEYQEAHDRVVAEWTNTAEALRQLQAEYDVLKEQKGHNKLTTIFKKNPK